MIKGLMGSGSVVVGGGNTSLPYINQNNSNPMQGMMRVNGSDMQVFDGNVWQTMMTSYATVNLTPEVESLIAWAREEKNKQVQRESLVRTNPALQKALAAIERAEANFDILSKFVEHDNDNTVQSSP